MQLLESGFRQLFYITPVNFQLLDARVRCCMSACWTVSLLIVSAHINFLNTNITNSKLIIKDLNSLTNFLFFLGINIKKKNLPDFAVKQYCSPYFDISSTGTNTALSTLVTV
eukprot:TRINITY_DN1327_c1_g1_i12.p7 TRINITY_DN1327_c1_g1~~TRINITY_DN1327_c1_g1_i12.p7  ORF type:complete len:112 (-),score=1.83 TRINITY_DN1327_c1_g1_i12:1042-1377(-)